MSDLSVFLATQSAFLVFSEFSASTSAAVGQSVERIINLLGSISLNISVDLLATLTTLFSGVIVFYLPFSHDLFHRYDSANEVILKAIKKSVNITATNLVLFFTICFDIYLFFIIDQELPLSFAEHPFSFVLFIILNLLSLITFFNLLRIFNNFSKEDILFKKQIINLSNEIQNKDGYLSFESKNSWKITTWLYQNLIEQNKNEVANRVDNIFLKNIKNRFLKNTHEFYLPIIGIQWIIFKENISEKIGVETNKRTICFDNKLYSDFFNSLFSRIVILPKDEATKVMSFAKSILCENSFYYTVGNRHYLNINSLYDIMGCIYNDWLDYLDSQEPEENKQLINMFMFELTINLFRSLKYSGNLGNIMIKSSDVVVSSLDTALANNSINNTGNYRRFMNLKNIAALIKRYFITTNTENLPQFTQSLFNNVISDFDNSSNQNIRNARIRRTLFPNNMRIFCEAEEVLLGEIALDNFYQRQWRNQ